MRIAARTRARELLDGALCETSYLVAQRGLRRSLSPTARTAVCIHLYYTDRWDVLARSLANLRDEQFDLFVTLPRGNRGFAATIRADFPDAHVTTVPNRGRGTLPFIKIAQVLMQRKYEVVLKLHCKKSGTGAGDAYLQVVLDRLLPESPRLTHEVIRQLSSGDAGLLGPSEVYMPLNVSFLANRDRMGELISELCGPAVARQVLDDPAGYGFFAGSMFWARLDAIEPLLRFRAFDFEPERGQIDGTLPHALERVFSLLPRLQGRKVLEAADGAIRPRESASCNVLWW